MNKNSSLGKREPLTAISSVDGRYRSASEALAPFLSEYGLIRARVRVECEYLSALAETKGIGIRKFTSKEKAELKDIAVNFSVDDAALVKKIEREGHKDIPATNHDVKAVEYFLKLKLAGSSLSDVREWVHFALTSEDTNNIAYAAVLGDALEMVLIPSLEAIMSSLDTMSREYAATPMLARTHGQSASPTTFGKEMRVFQERLSRQLGGLMRAVILVKCSGATGNWNAHVASAPEVDWEKFSEKFIESFNVTPKTTHKKATGVITLALNKVTTQIEPHDTYSELFDNLRRINTILIDLSQDMWRYISDRWVTQKPKEGEVGSSTMPHKVNPIDFENAEGNLGIANALFNHFSNKLPVSRLQRDLSDSTVERVFGTAFAHSLIAYTSLAKGLNKINVNSGALQEALDAHPEVLAEAIQTVLRGEGVEVPYEKLKDLTRGKTVTLKDFAEFIDGLPLSADLKKRLKSLRAENYIGRAATIARQDK